MNTSTSFTEDLVSNLFPDDLMPKNPLLSKWREKYPPEPKPEFSQVCDGYSCMWCGRCPEGEYWKCPEEDVEVYKQYQLDYSQWMIRHPDWMDRIFFR